MRNTLMAVACAAAVMAGPGFARAQQPVKIGLINVLSGQFADAGNQLDNGVKTYVKQQGDTVAGSLTFEHAGKVVVNFHVEAMGASAPEETHHH